MTELYSAWIARLTGRLEPMHDFLFPVKVMGLAQPYDPSQAGVQMRDVCYPALAMVWEWMFPPNVWGGLLCTALGLAVYLSGFLCVLKRFEVKNAWLVLLAVGFSAPVVFSFYVGNLIFYSAGALCFYFAWYDSPSRVRRLTAAFMLAVAAVLKIVPCLAGLLYLRKRDGRNLFLAGVSAVAFLALFLVPFAVCGGLEAVPLWFRNASLNSTGYAGCNGFGVYGLVGELARVVGYRCEVMSYVGPAARAGSVALALLCLWHGWRRSATREESMALLCLGMLFLPPTMMMYVTLYVLPVLVVLATRWPSPVARTSAFTAVAICLPIQLPLVLGTVGGTFTAVGLFDLALRLIRLALPKKGCDFSL